MATTEWPEAGNLTASAAAADGNIELIHQLFAVIDDGKEWNRLDRIVAADVVYNRPGYEAIRGIEALRSFYAHTRRIADGRHDIRQIVADGTRCSCWGLFAGHTKAGDEVSVYFADWYQISARKITYRRTFFYQPVI